MGGRAEAGEPDGIAILARQQTAGRGTKGDTFSARVNLANDRAAVEAQRSQVVRAQRRLPRLAAAMAMASVSSGRTGSRARPSAMDSISSDVSLRCRTP